MRIKTDWAKLSDDDCTLDQLVLLIEQEARKLEILKTTTTNPTSSTGTRNYNTNCHVATTYSNKPCTICDSGEHTPSHCPTLNSLTVANAATWYVKSLYAVTAYSSTLPRIAIPDFAADNARNLITPFFILLRRIMLPQAKYLSILYNHAQR